jgi:hypothetical protein
MDPIRPIGPRPDIEPVRPVVLPPEDRERRRREREERRRRALPKRPATRPDEGGEPRLDIRV